MIDNFNAENEYLFFFKNKYTPKQNTYLIIF